MPTRRFSGDDPDIKALHDRRRQNIIDYFDHNPIARQAQEIAKDMGFADGSFISQIRAKRRTVSENVARRMEKAMGIPIGALDLPPPGSKPKTNGKTHATPLGFLEATALATNVLLQLKAAGIPIPEDKAEWIHATLAKKAAREGRLSVDDARDML